MEIKIIREENDLRLDFGYHKGKLLSQVAEEEPGYVHYLVCLLAARLELCETRSRNQIIIPKIPGCKV